MAKCSEPVPVDNIVRNRELILARDPGLRQEYYIFSVAFDLTGPRPASEKEDAFAHLGVPRDPGRRKWRIAQAVRKLTAACRALDPKKELCED